MERYKSVSIELDTYEKLVELARRNYRSVPKELARLVDVAYETIAAEADAEIEAMKDKLMESLAATPDAK